MHELSLLFACGLKLSAFGSVHPAIKQLPSSWFAFALKLIAIGFVHPVIMQIASSPSQFSSMKFPQISWAPTLMLKLLSLQSPKAIPLVE